MRKFYISIIVACLFLNFNQLIAQTIWTGPITTFTRPDGLGVNWDLAINQDRITDIVWITRASNKGIFNIYSENIHVRNFSPADTEWAFGTTANTALTFSDWLTTVEENPPGMVGKDMVLHLITDNIYIDIKFLTWITGETEVEPGIFGAGGFSYQRSTDPSLATNEFELNRALKIYPNPSNDYIQIFGITKTLSYKIHNVLGSEIINGRTEQDEKINIQNLTKGIYVIHFENGITLKFMKK